MYNVKTWEVINLGTTLLKNAQIYDKAGWGRHEDIFVNDGVIERYMGQKAGDTYDMTGYEVFPGLFDAHMHIVTGDIEYNDVSLKYWAQSGVLVVRDLGLGNPKPLEDFLAYRETVDNPECAKCLTCGRFVTADHGYCHIMPDGSVNGLGVKSTQEAKDAVNYLLDAGCEGIKTAMDMGFGSTNILSQDELVAIAEESRKRGVWCCAHVLKAEYLPPLIKAGVTELAHIPTDYISDEILSEMVQKNIAVTPTLCTINAPKPPMGDMPKPPVGGSPGGGMPPMPEVNKDKQEAVAIDNVARFFKMGGKIAVGTDTMRMEAMSEPVGVPVGELRLLYKAGMSVEDVIDAATINAAEVCGIGESYGTVEPGKVANIIAVKSPLDETFEALEHVEFVMSRGEIIKNI